MTREDQNKMLTSSRQLHSPHSTMIQYKFAKFLITDQPTRQNMDLFVKECQSYHVRYLVRVCEPEYDTDDLEKAGIKVLDWLFDDGSPPPESIINSWHDLVKSRFILSNSEDTCVAVHCKAGLGRAPALVAISLIEMGLPYDEAIELIREKRKGAFNAKQIQFLKNYRPKRRFKTHSIEKCNIL